MGVLKNLKSRRALTKTQATIIALIIIIATVGVAVYYFTLPPKVQYKRTLTIAIPEEPEGLDIQQVSWSNEVHDLLFQPFTAFNENMGVVLDLAEFVTMDNNSITIKVPEDAKFSNGNPITAQIIADSIERYRKLSPYGSDYELVKDYEIINETTIKIIFNGPPTYVWYNDLTNVYGAVVDAETAKEIGDDAFNLNPIGSGPYKVKEWVQGSHVTLERNEFYKTNLPFVENKGPNPYIDEIIIRFIPEDLTRISELEAGNVEIVRGVPVDAISRLKENPDVTLYEVLTPGVEYIMINVRKPPLNDVRVRQAMMYAIDRDAIAVTLENTVLPCYSYMSPSMLAYNASLEEYAESMYAHNLEKAKDLLEEAGWVDTNDDGIVDKNGQPLELELLVPNDEPKLKRIGPLIQSQLAQIGIKVNIKEYTYDYIRDRTRNWDFELACRFYSWFDPAGILPYLLHSEMGNYTYSNPEVDELFELDRTTVLDPVERTNVYTKIQLILLNDTPWIPLFINKDYTAVRKTVEGLHVMPPFGTLYFNDVKVVQTRSYFTLHAMLSFAALLMPESLFINSVKTLGGNVEKRRK